MGKIIITFLLMGLGFLVTGRQVEASSSSSLRTCYVEAIDHQDGTWKITRIITCVGEKVSQSWSEVTSYKVSSNYYDCNYYRNCYMPVSNATPTITPQPTVAPKPQPTTGNTCQWNNPCGDGYRFEMGKGGYYKCNKMKHWNPTAAPQNTTADDWNIRLDRGCNPGYSWQLKNGYWSCWQ